jgi:hypothetical protein
MIEEDDVLDNWAEPYGDRRSGRSWPIRSPGGSNDVDLTGVGARNFSLPRLYVPTREVF